MFSRPGKMGWVALWAVLPVAAWLVLLQATPPAPPLWQRTPQSTCTPSTPAGQMQKQMVTPDIHGAFTLAANGIVSQQVCQAGVLRVIAQGTSAEQLYPLMTIGLDDQTLMTTRVAAQKSYQVNVPRAGLLTLAFHDDRYLPQTTPPQDRNLFVKAWKFTPLVTGSALPTPP